MIERMRARKRAQMVEDLIAKGREERLLLKDERRAAEDAWLTDEDEEDQTADQTGKALSVYRNVYGDMAYQEKEHSHAYCMNLNGKNHVLTLKGTVLSLN